MFSTLVSWFTCFRGNQAPGIRVYLKHFSFPSMRFIFFKTPRYLFHKAKILSREPLSFATGGFFLTRLSALRGKYQWRITLMEVTHHRTKRCATPRWRAIGCPIESQGTFYGQIDIEPFRSRSFELHAVNNDPVVVLCPWVGKTIIRTRWKTVQQWRNKGKRRSFGDLASSTRYEIFGLYFSSSMDIWRRNTGIFREETDFRYENII